MIFNEIPNVFKLFIKIELVGILLSSCVEKCSQTRDVTKRVQKRLKSPIKGEVVNLSNFERVLLKLLHSGSNCTLEFRTSPILIFQKFGII